MATMYADPNTVYSDNGRQYTTNGFNPYERNYLTPVQPTQSVAQQSPINNLLAQAMGAKANAPSIASLFPSMGAMSFGNPSLSMGGLLGQQNQFGLSSFGQASPFGQGSFGAGRFLGGNAMANYGSTSNAMNTM